MVVGADEKQALACRSIGVEGDNRDAGLHGLIDVVEQEGRGGDVNQDASGLFSNSLLQGLLFGFDIVALRTNEARADVQSGSRVVESGTGLLPIRNLDIG